MNADTKNHRLLAYVLDQKNNGVLNSIAFPAGPVKPGNISSSPNLLYAIYNLFSLSFALVLPRFAVWMLPVNKGYHANVYGASAFNPATRNWYWTAYTNGTSYDLLTVNVDTGALVSGLLFVGYRPFYIFYPHVYAIYLFIYLSIYLVSYIF